ncbi:hypothetical protein T03_4729 [Trichinella britovi]|uniref:Uncharacterized protein n=1 Tax=Trichinella britovi TaxID=45882 RepID=A0A0V1CZ20_TRIBR|nr:hypothetical protein T03_6663 [Trichinella britovi]KRY54466.1 hypothetical protein T03_4729 [Trichinella britovi]
MKFTFFVICLGLSAACNCSLEEVASQRVVDELGRPVAPAYLGHYIFVALLFCYFTTLIMKTFLDVIELYGDDLNRYPTPPIAVLPRYEYEISDDSDDDRPYTFVEFRNNTT